MEFLSKKSCIIIVKFAKNIIMTANNEKRIIPNLNYPIAFLSILILIIYFLSLFDIQKGNNLVVSSLIWSVLSSGFIGANIFCNSKKTASLTCGILCLNLFYYFICGEAFSLFFTVVACVLLSKICNDYSFENVFYISVGVCVLLGVIFGLLYEPGLNITRFLANAVNGNSFVFAIINDAYSLLFGSAFSDLFYIKDYAGALMIDNKLVSGVTEIFKADKENPASCIAVYMTGRYFANVFLSIGIFVSLYSRVKDKYMFSFITALLLCLISGNNLAFGIFLVFYNPFIYIGYLLCIALDNFLCSIVDIRIGYEVSPSLFEMIKYIDKPMYFLLIGVLSSVLMYFVSCFVLAKYDLDNHRILPKSVRTILKYLGGEENISSIDNGLVYVKNPNLIDILMLDCLIKENAVTLNTEDYDLIKKHCDL